MMRFPSADVVICWQIFMDELCQLKLLMELSTNGHTTSIPINELYSGWGPVVALLDVL
jgi:hypothetical protein